MSPPRSWLASREGLGNPIGKESDTGQAGNGNDQGNQQQAQFSGAQVAAKHAKGKGKHMGDLKKDKQKKQACPSSLHKQGKNGPDQRGASLHRYQNITLRLSQHALRDTADQQIFEALSPCFPITIRSQLCSCSCSRMDKDGTPCSTT
jgi:hypothetical protein